jgi:ferrochelatase
VVRDYHDHPAYIRALSECIQEVWSLHGKPEKLLFSYHGIPKRYATRKGEFYQSQCQTTTQLITGQLGLSPSNVLLSYQSKFGPEPWLTPYTEERLTSFGEQNCGSLHVVCPGFAVDCLETLEEIAIQGKAAYTQAGGSEFLYIPALNDTNGHIEALVKIISDAVVRGFKKGER